MSTELATANSATSLDKSAYADILTQLGQLSRDMLLAFRLQVGKLMLDRFYDGQIHDYATHAANKDASFAEFMRACKEDLAEFGLGPQTLRQCIKARAVYDLLPPSTRDDMKFMHVVELGRVAEPTARARLAMDVKLGQWSVDQLKEAIGQYRNGRYYDTEPLHPGTQPPKPAPQPEHNLPAGRLVNQLAKTAAELDAWHATMRATDASKLRNDQRVRYALAVAAIKARIADIEAELTAK
ncbi:MAG: hypothetical protein HY902_06230 [Deltaproteobacteria bacterium]|nr:hypothetical protein [Deltaproteobacteria bacterium]